MPDFVAEIEAFCASFSPDEVALSRHAFRTILGGTPALVADLPSALGLSPQTVDAALARLAERGTVAVERDPDRIVGVRGLSLRESDHRLALAGRPVLYAWCAVDAVGIPAALEADGRVDSRCRRCGTPLALEIRGGAVARAPEGIVLWAVERDLSRSLRAHT